MELNFLIFSIKLCSALADRPARQHTSIYSQLRASPPGPSLLYVPPEKMLNRDFIKQLLTEEKKLLGLP